MQGSLVARHNCSAPFLLHSSCVHLSIYSPSQSGNIGAHQSQKLAAAALGWQPPLAEVERLSPFSGTIERCQCPHCQKKCSANLGEKSKGKRRVGMSGDGIEAGTYSFSRRLLKKKKLMLLKEMLVTVTFMHLCSKARFLSLLCLCNTPLQSFLMHLIAFWLLLFLFLFIH